MTAAIQVQDPSSAYSEKLPGSCEIPTRPLRLVANARAVLARHRGATARTAAQLLKLESAARPVINLQRRGAASDIGPAFLTLSSSGLGHRPFTAVTRVRIPLGSLLFAKAIASANSNPDSRLDLNCENRVKRKRRCSPMKTPFSGPCALRCIRVFLMATCVLAVTPRLSADIILVNRLSDAEAAACGYPVCSTPPPQRQTGFSPAQLTNSAEGCTWGIGGCGCFTATSTSNSSILINTPMDGLRVVGDGTSSSNGSGSGYCAGHASAKLIVLSFTLTDISYPYSMTGQLNGPHATATLTGETGTIFARAGTSALSVSGTLPPGNYTLSVTVEFGGGNSNANFTFALDGPVSKPRATNLSTRLSIGTGNEVGIGGFIVTGSSPRHLLLRGMGPSLSQFGIQNFPADPILELLGPNGFIIGSNDNWRDTQETEIIATGRAPSNDLESAMVADFAPGAYTAILAGNADAIGVGLLEIYDLSANQDSRLANISTRGKVGTGDDIMIAGFILHAGGNGEDAIIVRGLGPSLSAAGLGLNALPDPKLELRNSQGALIASNDNWMDDPNQAAIIQGAGLAPGNNLESAVAVTLMPGEYTALLSGVNNGTGVGLVEVYSLEAPAH